ncbi:MAG: hypothetical protein WA173_17135, partial [Pseudomonas sp.]|uniref:hypothetical protein n=1 Tax=Pseudomonas sp. TaxID=306 RepID=UPI003BB65F51
INTQKVGVDEALAAAGLSLWQQDGEWVTTDGDEAKVQAFLDAYVAPLSAELMAINSRASALLAVVKFGIPGDEIDSWPKQEQEARAGGGPLTDALAAARGIDPPLLRTKIIAKADAYAVYSGAIIGTRQALEDRLLAGDLSAAWPD